AGGVLAVGAALIGHVGVGGAIVALLVGPEDAVAAHAVDVGDAANVIERPAAELQSLVGGEVPADVQGVAGLVAGNRDVVEPPLAVDVVGGAIVAHVGGKVDPRWLAADGDARLVVVAVLDGEPAAILQVDIGPLADI